MALTEGDPGLGDSHWRTESYEVCDGKYHGWQRWHGSKH